MASAAEKTNITDNKPSAAGKEVEKPSASFATGPAALSIAAPPAAPPSPPSLGGTAQLKASTQTGSFGAAVAQMKANSTGLPDNLKSGIENLSGNSMDNVKVHYNSSQPSQLNAHAYAQGTDIHAAPGQERHLPHEAWHVVQQAQGRVKPTMQMKMQPGVVAQRSGIEEEETLQGKGIEEEELLQAKPVAQRAGIEEEELIQGKGIEEEELLQAKPVAQREAIEEEEEEAFQLKTQPGAIQRKGNAANTSGTSMPAEVQAKMESSMGADFSDVNIHANSSKATDLGAQAYAQGTDIHMAPGKYDPGSTSGQELLGHELAHVVQQREGRVKPTIQAKGVPVNDDAGLEKEADIMGAKAARSAAPPVQQKANATTIGPMPLQRKGVAQLEGGESAVAEPEVEGNERDEEEDAGGEQEVPIPPFPTISRDEAEEAEVESQEARQEQAPTIPPPPPPPPRRQPPSSPPPSRPPGMQQRPPGPPPPLPPRPARAQAPAFSPNAATNAGPVNNGPTNAGNGPRRPPSTPPPAHRPRRINPNAGSSPLTNETRYNINADGTQDYVEYGILAPGVSSSAASAGLQAAQYGDTIKNGYDWGSMLQGELPKAATGLGKTAAGISGLGVAGGALGTAAAVADGVRAGQYIANKDHTAGDRAMTGGGALLSAGGSALKESSTMAFHSANLAGDTVAAAGAASMAGIGSVAMGSADIIRGTYGAVKADQRATKLRGIKEWTQDRDVLSAATQAESTQEIIKSHSKGTVFKGLLLVGGGAALIIMGSNPIGWGLLAGAAIVGGINSLRRYLAKRARKKDVAIRELNVTNEYQAYKEKKAERKKNTNIWTRRKLPPLESPLDREMVKRGYAKDEYAKFYADYIHDTAWVLYNCGIMGDQSVSVNREMRGIIENIGLKVVDKESPKPEQIAKSLHQ